MSIEAPYRFQYETVAASQTAQVLGGAGAPGDYLKRIICTVGTAATSTVTLLDGATSIPLLPAAVGAGVGTYSFDIEAACTTVWKVTTGAGATVIATGIFTA